MKLLNVNQERLLTEKDVADRLNVNVQTLRNWRFQGRNLPYVKIGRSVRYKDGVVADFIEENTVAPEK